MTRLPASLELRQRRMARSVSRRAVLLLVLMLAMAGAYAAKAAPGTGVLQRIENPRV